GAAVIFRTMRKTIGVRFTIKIRGGWDERTVNAVEIAHIAEGEGVDAITVHPRTRSQQYTGVAPWEIIARVVDAVAIPVVGNGDVRCRADAAAMVAATGCAAVMIGRGALGAPLFFAGMTGDNHPIHYDDEYGKKTRYGGRLAHGLLLTSLTAVGASTLAPHIEESIVAFVEQSTRFRAPVFISDTIRPEHEVVAL